MCWWLKHALQCLMVDGGWLLVALVLCRYSWDRDTTSPLNDHDFLEHANHTTIDTAYPGDHPCWESTHWLYVFLPIACSLCAADCCFIRQVLVLALRSGCVIAARVASCSF